MAALSGILRQWNPGIAPGLSLWVDGSDSKTLTVAGGGVGGGSNISAIRDKSGLNIELVQGTASNQPVLTSNINRLQTIGFRGENYVSTTTSYFPSIFNNTNAISQFTILNLRSNNTQGITSIVDSNYNIVSSSQFSFGLTPNNFRLFKNGNGTQLGITLPTPSNFFVEGYLQSNRTTLYLLNNNSSEFVLAPTPINNLTQFLIGRRPGIGANVFYGDIGEILIYNSNVYTSNTAFHPQIEGYLAWKWGLRSLLESTHPYKNRYPS